MKKPIGLLESIGRVAIWTICCPCIFILYCRSSADAPIDDFCVCCEDEFIRKGFIIDYDETERLKAEDDRQLDLDRNNIVSFIEKGTFPILDCPDYLQHQYMKFVGPASKLTYVIFIPNGNFYRAELITLTKASFGENLRELDIAEHVRFVASSYRDVKPNYVKEVTEKVPVQAMNYGTP